MATPGTRRLDPATIGDHLDRLYRVAVALCGSLERAEDLVQDTYVRVLSKPRYLRNDDDLGYLLRVLRNMFISQHRPTASGRRWPPPPSSSASRMAPHDVRTRSWSRVSSTRPFTR